MKSMYAIRYPKLIVEVRSEGTEVRDRGEKLKEFRGLASLEEYVLVSSTEMEVEIYWRGEGRMWLYTAYQSGELIRLESLDFECRSLCFMKASVCLEHNRSSFLELFDSICANSD